MLHFRPRVANVVGDRLISSSTSLAKQISYSMREGRKISGDSNFIAAAERCIIAPANVALDSA